MTVNVASLREMVNNDTHAQRVFDDELTIIIAACRSIGLLLELALSFGHGLSH